VDSGSLDFIAQSERAKIAFRKLAAWSAHGRSAAHIFAARGNAPVGTRRAVLTYHHCLRSDFTQRLYQSSMSSPDAADGSGKPKIGGNGPSGPGCPAAMPGANASLFPTPLLLGVKTRSLKLRPLRGPGCVEAADCAEGTGKMERDDEPIGKMEPDFRSDL